MIKEINLTYRRPYVMMYNFLYSRVDKVYSLGSLEECKAYIPQDEALYAQLEAYIGGGNTPREAIAFAIEDYCQAAYDVLASWYGDKSNDQ